MNIARYSIHDISLIVFNCPLRSRLVVAMVIRVAQGVGVFWTTSRYRQCRLCKGLLAGHAFPCGLYDNADDHRRGAFLILLPSVTCSLRTDVIEKRDSVSIVLPLKSLRSLSIGAMELLHSAVLSWPRAQCFDNFNRAASGIYCTNTTHTIYVLILI